MKLFAKTALAAFLVLVLPIAGTLGWFFFRQGDLPDVRQLANFAPDAPGVVVDPCLSQAITVAPALEIGKEFRDAIKAAEQKALLDFRSADFLLLCESEHRNNLRLALDEYRLDWHIRRRFSQDQLLAIYMNRVYIGNGMFGVTDASHRFFGKKSKDLTVAEAALLAGMIRAPGKFSPYKYADAALERRNQVIEAMRAQGTISPEEAATAKAKPLGVLSQTAN